MTQRWPEVEFHYMQDSEEDSAVLKGSKGKRTPAELWRVICGQTVLGVHHSTPPPSPYRDCWTQLICLKSSCLFYLLCRDCSSCKNTTACSDREVSQQAFRNATSLTQCISTSFIPSSEPPTHWSSRSHFKANTKRWQKWNKPELFFLYVSNIRYFELSSWKIRGFLLPVLNVFFLIDGKQSFCFY